MDAVVWVVLIVVVLAALLVWFAVARHRSRVGGVLAAPQRRGAGRRRRVDR